jgi:uncharacterized protein YcsI (UPF0317 family)
MPTGGAVRRSAGCFDAALEAKRCITSRFPSVHGAPVHIGLPQAIGIVDLGKPDYGDAVPVKSDELPVFWACGVTPQAVIAQVRPEFCITHAPGSMLITDLVNSKLASL